MKLQNPLYLLRQFKEFSPFEMTRNVYLKCYHDFGTVVVYKETLIFFKLRFSYGTGR